MSDAILSFLTEQEYLAIFILMFVENIFPPIPSEVILPFIGYLTSTGALSFPIALLAASLGSILGTSFWFFVGWVFPVSTLERFFRKYGGYIAITLSDFKKATDFFNKYKKPAVFLGRMIPAVRSVISIPAGCVRMDIKTFFILSICGTMIWNLTLISFGHFILDDYKLVEKIMSPVADIIIYLFIAIYFIQVIRFLKNKKNNN